MAIFSVLSFLETYIVMQIYLAAIRGGDKERKISYHEAIFVVLMPFSTKTHYTFISSLHNDFFSVALGYLAILCLQHSRVFLCVVFYR